MWVATKYITHGEAGTNVERVKIILLKQLNLFLNKDKEAARVFYICIKHHSSARNRKLDPACKLLQIDYKLKN